MEFRLINHEKTYRYRNRHKITFTLNGKCFIALYWNNIEPIIYDAIYDDKLSRHKWMIHSVSKKAYEPGSYIMMDHVITNAPRRSCVKRITNNKTDNRLVNLVVPFTSENSQKPFPELETIGILQYPKYIVWCELSNSFWIIGHPMLTNRSLPCFSTHEDKIRKYFHAVGVLAYYDNLYRTRLCEEYDEIKDFVKLVAL